jgi:Ca-activated chloride channel family protein
MRATPGLFALLTACICLAQSQIHVDVNQAEAPIRVDVNLVNVAFTVRDTRGALVNDLTRDDFEVFEDAVPQSIAFFARSADVPLSLGLVVDFSGSQEHFLKQHHKDLLAFLGEVLGPRDQAFLVCFGNYLRLVSDFSPLGDSLVDELQRYEKGKRNFPQLGPPEDRELGTAFYDAIYYPVTEKLARTDRGRRALLVFSDGEDNSSSHNMMEAIEAAQAADVLVFALRYTEYGKEGLTARNRYGTGVMARIARETGGADYDARKTDLPGTFRRIGEELRLSYELAYHASNPAQDGTFRKIVVRARRPGLTVRSKTGYLARAGVPEAAGPH